MTIIRWTSPTRYADIFDNMFGQKTQDIDKKECDCVPAVNTMKTDIAFIIDLAVPGYNKEDIHIDLENNILSIYCDKDQTEGKEINYTRHEFGFGTFRRSFSLPKTVDANKISADYKNGILSLTLPKLDEDIHRVSREIKIS